MTNPYVLASVRKMQQDRKLRLPSAQSGDGHSERIDAFLSATAIGHRGNRARVCTGIANTMSDDDLQKTYNLLTTERDRIVQKLVELDAPEVIITNARKETQAIGILRRVIKKRLPKGD